jgi:hypothetical protein
VGGFRLDDTGVASCLPIQPLPNFRSAPTSPNGRLPVVFEHPLLREVFFLALSRRVRLGILSNSSQLTRSLPLRLQFHGKGSL